jgi:hypothetical protein
MSAATPLGNRFATTRWSQVVAAGGGGGEARAAMAWLCERYWQPLRASCGGEASTRPAPTT